MAEIINFNDHRLLKNYAVMQGLNYKEYRWTLRECNINLEEAIDNIKKGITINECLRKREKVNSMYSIGMAVLIMFGTGLGSYIAYQDRDKSETKINDKETLTEFVMKYGIQ